MKSEELKGKGGKFWVGVDVSKKTFDAAIAGAEQRFPGTPLRELPWKSFARTPDGVVEFVAWLVERVPCGDVRVVMEATGRYSLELTMWLSDARASFGPAIVNPINTKAFLKSLNQRNKTDGLDARGLAFYGVERRPVPYVPLSKAQQKLRELSRCRDALVAQRTAWKNRSYETPSTKLVVRIQARQLRQLDRTIKEIESEMKAVIMKDDTFKGDFELLITIDGVGPLTAMTVLAEIGDLRRFGRARQLAAYVGVSPRIYQSGTSVHGRTRMCKRGNARLRQALYLSAMATLNTKHPNSLSTMHHRLTANGKNGKSALGAIMHKQLTVMRAVIISGKPYDPNYKRGGITSGKLNEHTV